jgi:hypothetical protein
MRKNMGIMKKYQIVLILLLLPYAIFAQIPNGLYRDTTYHPNSRDYILFSNDHASFYILTNYAERGLTKMIRGEGSYRIVKKFLIISTEKYTGIRSSVEKIESNRFEIKVIYNDDVFRKIGVTFLDKYKKSIGYGIIDTNSFMQLKVPVDTKYISTASFYQTLCFEYEDGFKYIIYLSLGDVIENENVIFKINNIKKDRLKLIYTEYKCESGNINREDIREINMQIEKFGLRKRKYYLVNQ